MSEACIFCRIIAGDLPGTFVERTDRAVAFMDINPGTRGHTLVVPTTHTEDLLSVEPDDLTATVMLAQQIARRAVDRLGAEGVNLLQSSGSVAWQTVPHLHMHVIPRYSDDPLVLPWQPEPGDPSEIAQAAEALRP